MKLYRTDDLALATYLNMEGLHHEHLEMASMKAAKWVFREDEDLLEAVSEFESGEAAVHPGDFARKLKWVRDELYQFLRANGVPTAR